MQKKCIFTILENETLRSAVFHIPIHARCVGHDKICVFQKSFIFLILYFVTIQEEIKSRLKLGNLLSSRLLSKNLKIKIYRTKILPLVLYGCENWSMILREAPSLRVFGNRVLRRVFGPKRDEVSGECRKLHNEELNELCTPYPMLCRW